MAMIVSTSIRSESRESIHASSEMDKRSHMVGTLLRICLGFWFLHCFLGPNLLEVRDNLILCLLPDSMAKWGEGDPRWIVEERPDATNVNNWHW